MRSEYRNVEAPGQRSEPTALEPFGWESEQLKHIRELLGECVQPKIDLDAHLEQIASQHLRWRKQPQPSKGETVYQLKLLAYLAGRIVTGKSEAKKARQEFLEVLCDLNDTARAMLWNEIGRHDAWATLAPKNGQAKTLTPMEYLAGEEIDIGFVGECAAHIWPRLNTRGDCPDPDLTLSVNEPVALFEKWTGKRATFSTRGVRRHTQDQPASDPASQCSRFVTAFFKYVEPDLARSKPANTLRALLRSRR